MTPTAYIPIVLAADYRYAEQVTTTIKSILAHNSFVKFYLIHNDFPSEWFSHINQKMTPFHSEIISKRIDVSHFEHFSQYTYPHILSSATFFRYAIPSVIDEDKLLYLDSDLVVNGNLTSLFNIDLEHHYIAAVKDIIADKYHKKVNIFNAGVMLINNKLWKQENITEKAFQLSHQLLSSIENGDQDILNILFKDKWLKINRGYNYQIGVDGIFKKSKQTHYLEDLGDNIPLIVHYVTELKPWKITFKTRFRDLYWHYAFLDWNNLRGNS